MFFNGWVDDNVINRLDFNGKILDNGLYNILKLIL